MLETQSKYKDTNKNKDTEVKIKTNKDKETNRKMKRYKEG
jgi:hypothetical protein